MVRYLESSLSGASSDFFSNFFMYVIILVFVGGIYCSKKGKAQVFVLNAPVILTSLGILGTFLGISIGLVSFDSSNIDSSISNLLAGMKTAFFTSVLGMFFSIVFKVIQFFIKNEVEHPVKDASINDLLCVMQTQNETLTNLTAALGGDGDTSILSQIKILRTDINDSNKINQRNAEDNRETLKQILQYSETQKQYLEYQKESFASFTSELWKQMQNFSDMLSKSATEAVIDALKQVIVDFNNNLTEQFGDNFKELNSAVKELVLWQENYKYTMEKIIEQYELIIKLVDNVEKSISVISHNTSEIPKNMDKLRDIIDIQQYQLQELSERLDSFREIRDRAVEALPIINSQIEKIISGASEASKEVINKIDNIAESISQVVESNIDNCNNLVQRAKDIQDITVQNVKDIQIHIQNALSTIFKEYGQNIQKVIDKIDSATASIAKATDASIDNCNNLIKSTKDVQNNLIENLKNVQSSIETTLESIFREQNQNIQRVFSNIDAGLKTQVERTGSAVEKQLGMIDKSMQDEISRVMSTMGRALGQISNQFTNDYSKLVSEMKRIVSNGRG